MPFTYDHGLVRPHGPKGHKGHEVFILQYDPFLLFKFELQVIMQQAFPVLFEILLLLCCFFYDLQWQRGAGPNLPMRMWIATAHYLTFVFEDLDVFYVAVK